MNKREIMNKVKFGAKVFMKGFTVQLGHGETHGVAATIGIMQGLKYNGNLNRGIKTYGVMTVGMCAANGIKTVFENIEAIKEA